MTPHLQRAVQTWIFLCCEKSSNSVFCTSISQSFRERLNSIVPARDEWIKPWRSGIWVQLRNALKKKKIKSFIWDIACSKFYTLSNSHKNLSKISHDIFVPGIKKNRINYRKVELNKCGLYILLKFDTRSVEGRELILPVWQSLLFIFP
jgi:hypothetical protein